jgi:hypothetical protein
MKVLSSAHSIFRHKNVPSEDSNNKWSTMDKRRSERSEKRRQRVSSRSLTSTRTMSLSTQGSNLPESMVIETSTFRKSRRGISLEKLEEGTIQKNTDDAERPTICQQHSGISFPGAFRVSSIMIAEADMEDVVIEESSTAGSISSCHSPQVFVPSASLVEEKVQAVDEAVTFAHAQNIIFVNKRVARCLVCTSCMIFVALAGGLLLAFYGIDQLMIRLRPRRTLIPLLPLRQPSYRLNLSTLLKVTVPLAIV